VPRTDLAWALGQFRDTARLGAYHVSRDYYDGKHDSTYDERRFRSVFAGRFANVRANICQVVVDSLTDRLEIVGFEAGGKRVSKRLQELWDANVMDLVANEIHREAFKAGDSYLIIQPDELGEPTFWFNKADEVAVVYSDTRPGVIEMAAKLWCTPSGVWRLNLYYADRIEKYVADRPRKDILAPDVTEDFWVPYTTGGLAGDGTVPWEYGQVPVFHFANKALYRYGYSELLEIVPLQDAINKTIGDLLVTSEFSSFKQKYVTGLTEEELTSDSGQRLLTGIDKILVATEPDAKFGEFTASDLGQFLSVIDHFMRQVARISGIPLHFIYETSGDFPSGDALKTAEARFVKKLADKQTAFGNVWEQALRFALAIDRRPTASDIEVVWRDTAPQSEKEKWEVMLMKKAIGVPLVQLFREAGYTQQQSDDFAAAVEASPPPADAGAVIPTANGRIQVNRTDFPSAQ
jgi:hypothetical protein